MVAVERGGGVTGVDEDVAAQVVGAPEGRAAVLADVGLGARRKAAAVCVQHHRLLSRATQRGRIKPSGHAVTVGHTA